METNKNILTLKFLMANMTEYKILFLLIILVSSNLNAQDAYQSNQSNRSKDINKNKKLLGILRFSYFKNNNAFLNTPVATYDYDTKNSKAYSLNYILGNYIHCDTKI